MKHTKTIIIAAVATLILTAGIVVSCNKESNNQETTSTNATSQQKTRGNDPWQLLNQKMIDFWQYCDHAYCSDTGAFMSVCRDEDYTRFYRLTGIPESLENSIDSLMQIVIRNYEQQHPSTGGGTMEPSTPTNPCSQCASSPLSRLGQSIKEIRDFCNSNSISDPTPLMVPPPEMDEWLFNCLLGCNDLSDLLGERQMCKDACFVAFMYMHAVEHYNAPEPNLE
jgi:hypothetical protein